MIKLEPLLIRKGLIIGKKKKQSPLLFIPHDPQFVGIIVSVYESMQDLLHNLPDPLISHK